ncbi:oxygenase MpaB family protein [Dietzia lutea]|nr:oxygenase MpaB family protein [Dietzia lutea]
MTAGTRTDIAKVEDRRIRRLPDISTHLAFWLPAANVVMQLANPAVGYGVVESRVDSGRGDLRPIKRGRTTAQYLAVATLGSEKDRQFFHEAVHEIHAQVTSTESSPVRYNANHAGYQLWVALCLVRYYTDQWEMLHGPLSEAELDRIIDIARPLGTTLNVPEARWPSTWAEYEQRFVEGLEDVTIDDTVREYLQSLTNFRVLEIRMGKLGTLAHKTIGPWNLSMTKFAVPRRIRDEMHWEITPGDLRRRRLVLAASTALGKVLPKPLRAYYACNILDLRVRRALGISVF